jgi:1,4-alpha-glucan branching enzyme
MCCKIEDGGVGFDYRLGMAIPDFWIKMLKDTPDEDWNIWEMWSILTNRLPSVKTVAYAESHDQALVGDKTIAFRLLDKLMYDSMDRKTENLVVDRGMALHKMIRLITITCGGEAYLNFMGNEFGHPEWIDFPREGNGWSCQHARRIWSIRDNEELRYGLLAEFDKAMIELVKENRILSDGYPYNLMMDEQNKTMVYSHRDLIFVLNWHSTASIPDYEIPLHEAGKYELLLSSDEERFGGHARHQEGQEYFSFNVEGEDGTLYPRLKIYNTSRTALVLRKVD